MDWIQKYLVNVIYICISTKGPSPSENKENFGIFITLATKDVGFGRTLPHQIPTFSRFFLIEGVLTCHVQLISQWSVQLYNNQSLVGHDRLRSCKRETKWLLRVVHNKWQSCDSLEELFITITHCSCGQPGGGCLSKSKRKKCGKVF